MFADSAAALNRIVDLPQEARQSLFGVFVFA
jgi:hypothetical protein